jgi:Zn-dependent M28 family amino/carboxypeptidase
MEGRGTGQPGQRKAAEYIAFEFGKIGLLPLIGSPENKYFQRFLYNSTDSTENVLGYIPAKKPSSEWIVLTAHYDHLGKTGEKIYCGADDNASGTTGILEIAEACSLAKQSGTVFNKNILFIAFSAEELGLLGSKQFVFSPPGDTLNIALNINLDMIGKSIRYGFVETFVGMENEHFKEDTSYRQDYVYVFNNGAKTCKYTRMARKSARDQKIRIDKTPGFLTKATYKTSSDHKHFYDAGIPIMVFFTGLHPDYHTARDTPEKIDYENLTGIIKIIFETVYNIATK